MNDLKPCPFCGENKHEIEHMEGTILHPAYVVKCGHCGAQAPWSDKGDHVDKWNQRAATDNKEQSWLTNARDSRAGCSATTTGLRWTADSFTSAMSAAAAATRSSRSCDE